jgi:hypothetical protein
MGEADTVVAFFETVVGTNTDVGEAGLVVVVGAVTVVLKTLLAAVVGVA